LIPLNHYLYGRKSYTTQSRKTHQGNDACETGRIGNGTEHSPATVSTLEAKETIDPETLEQIAKILGVPVDAIKNFNEEAQVYNIQHNYEGQILGAIAPPLKP